MINADYQIEGMTIAVTHMDHMLDFYSSVFGILFDVKEMFGSILYAGLWGNLQLLFCPAEIAQNTANQNRHQFDIVVSNLSKIIELATKHHGKLMGDIVDSDTFLSVGIYDPDNNSIHFKQLKNYHLG